MTKHKDAPLETDRCTPACNYGHCRLVREEWFTRALSLERKRTERSRKPFILALLNLEGMDKHLAAQLARQNVRSRDDLADLAVDELVELTQIDEERAKNLITTARAHWFAE